MPKYAFKHVRCPITLLGWLILCCLGAFMPSTELHASGALEETLFDNGNISTVYNNPTQATEFSITNAYQITYIETYHWNNQTGKTPGQISLRHTDGTVYGPWQATGRVGQLNVPNAYWFVSPYVVIKAGSYTIIDSDPASWSHNNQSGNRGFAVVKGIQWNDDDLSPFARMGATVTEFKFFEAGYDIPPLEQRQFNTTFSKDSSRYIYYQLTLTYPALADRVDFTLTARYYKADGSLFGEFEHQSYALSGWTTSWHVKGWGWSSAGNWPEGTYTVKLFDGETQVTQGTFSISDGDLPPDEWLINFPISITTSTADDFLPAATFTSRPFKLRRSYDPLGTGTNWFESSRIRAARGGLRITDLEIGGAPYWVDMQINVQNPALPLQIVNFQPGDPQIPFPPWYAGYDMIDFRLSKADIFGPPAYFSIFDVGIGGVAYNVNFLLSGNGYSFVLSGSTPSGYLHYLPDATAPDLGVLTRTQEKPVLSGSGLCFSNVPYGSPIAIFNVNGLEGENYLTINYCSDTVTQKFDISDGIAIGTYAPPTGSAQFLSMEHSAEPFGSWNPFSRPTRDQQLQQCIRDQTTLNVGLQRDNQLGDALLGIVTSFASDLKLGNKTLDAAKDAVLDGKDIIADLYSTGKVDPAKMSEFVLKTLLKNATPEEHEKFVEKFFGNNVPEHFQTLVEGSATAQEKQYKLALLGITKSVVKTVFPKSSALAESVVEAQKWAIETMADEDIKNLYESYKNNNGNWDDTYNSSSLYRANQRIKIRQILQKQGKTPSDANVESYLKNLFEGYYQQEKNFPAKQQQLEAIKAKYDDDYFLRAEVERLMPDATECERLLKVMEWLNNAQLDFIESMGACKNGKPDRQSIRDIAFSMLKQRMTGSGSDADRLAAYQKTKLDYLKLWDCLRYEEPARSETCDDVVKEGADEAEVLHVQLGKTSGTFAFAYETYGVQDRVIVAYQNTILYDSGCVGTNGEKSVTLSYSGTSSMITVRVEPNCSGTTGTQWYFKVSCPQ